MAESQQSGDERERIGFDSDTQLWATHALECQQCHCVFPVAYAGKAIALREYGGVAEECPKCEEYTACEEAQANGGAFANHGFWERFAPWCKKT